MGGRRSNTALSTKTLKEEVGKEQLVHGKLAEEFSSLLLLSLLISPLSSLLSSYSVSCVVPRLCVCLLIAMGLFIEVPGVIVPPKNAPQ